MGRVLKLVAAFIFGTKVAGTISGEHGDNKLIDIYVVAAGLLGAIIWNIITWLLGLPTSSSTPWSAGSGARRGEVRVHRPQALGVDARAPRHRPGPHHRVPLGSLNMIWIFVGGPAASPPRIDRLFRRLQLVSAALYYSLGHGVTPREDDGHHRHAFERRGAQAPHRVRPEPLHEPLPQSSAGTTPRSRGGSSYVPRRHLLGTMFGGCASSKRWKRHHAPPTRGRFSAETARRSPSRVHQDPGVSHLHHPRHQRRDHRLGTTRGIRSVPVDLGRASSPAWILTLPLLRFMATLAYLLLHLCLDRSYPVPKP